MDDDTLSGAASQRLTATNAGPVKPAGWRLVNLSCPTTQIPSDPNTLNYHHDATPGWSAVHDFERRLSRNGIKVSEATNSTTCTVQIRGGKLFRGSSHHATRSEDFPPLESPTMAAFATTRDNNVDVLERRLRQAQMEAEIWRDKAEMQELDLRASYQETMQWRMKYEDLYSSVIRDQDPKVDGPRAKRGATKSWG